MVVETIRKPADRTSLGLIRRAGKGICMSERHSGSSMLKSVLLSISLLVIAITSSGLHAAESSIEITNCGQFLEREFDEIGQIHDYKVWMEPGETMVLRVVPIGSTLLVKAYVYEPANQVVKESAYQNEVRLTTGKLSARGFHIVRVINTRYIGDDDGRVGVYTLDVSCVRSDGSRVEPGTQGRGPAPAPVGQPTASPLQAASNLADAAAGLQTMGKYADDVQKLQNISSAVSGTLGGVVGAVEVVKDLWSVFRKVKGKKGEAQETSPVAPPPVYQRAEDLIANGGQPLYAAPVESMASPSLLPSASGAVPTGQVAAVDRQTFPLLGLGALFRGEITASNGAQGCRFKAQAGQGINLTFERLTGEQSLVVTVFGPDQRPVFQTSVLASPQVTTTLHLPVAGEYAVEIAPAGGGGVSPARFSLHLAAASK